VTLNESIDTSLQQWGDNPCLLERKPDGGCVSITAQELRIHIKEITEQLERWGIRKGFLVPLFIGNSTGYIAILIALMNLGAIPVMVKLEYRKYELTEIFRNCRPQAVITEINHLPILKPFLERTLVIGKSAVDFRLIQSQRKHEPTSRIADDIATVNYTYRGYGYPLGALVPHSQYLHGAKELQRGLQGNPGEKMLIILPMSHIFTLVGCIVAPILNKMTSVIARTIHPKTIFQLIRDYSIEYITSIPQIYLLLLRLKEETANLSSLRAFVSGGSLLTDEEYRKISEGFNVEVLHGYGLTECTPVSRNKRGEAKGGTIGPICDKIDCRIDSVSGLHAGEILIKTPYMTKEYLNRAWETGEAFKKDWFITGDRGYFQGDHLVFLNEIKNTRKINGNLVDLNEVKNAILMDKQITEVDILHSSNSLFARCRASRKINSTQKTRELTSSLKELLAVYKIPNILIE
jgi:long-subunit acyl-CoA synthetase (AMP-forming)